MQLTDDTAPADLPETVTNLEIALEDFIRARVDRPDVQDLVDATLLAVNEKLKANGVEIEHNQ